MKNLYFVVDVETAGGFACPLVYDFGFKVVDNKGNEYANGSFMINEVIRNYKLMRTAYYKDKLPQYWEDYQRGEREVISIVELSEIIEDVFATFKIRAVCAYNAKFDVNALIKTFSYFGYNYNPFGSAEIFDIWGMACETLGQQKKFFKSVDENEWLSACGNPRTSAEIMWRYITNELDFEESHTGFEDVEIECEIMRKCFSQHKKMTRYIIPNPWQMVATAYRDYKE